MDKKISFGELKKAIFLQRENRFCARVNLDGEEILVHVPNSGRMSELLYASAEVWLKYCQGENRKTAYDMVLVKGKDGYVCTDAHLANDFFEHWIKEGLLEEFANCYNWKRECKYGNSRFDFAFSRGDKNGFLEVKSVNLLQEKTALFPDAPTKRGAKHLLELAQCIEEGYLAYVVFVVMGKCDKFAIYKEHDEMLWQAMQQAKAGGVSVVVYQCKVSLDGVLYGGRVCEVEL